MEYQEHNTYTFLIRGSENYKVIVRLDELESVLDKVQAGDDRLLALDIAGILLGNAIGAYQYTDDSDGSVGYLIGKTIEVIRDIAEEAEHFNEQEEIFNKIITLLENRYFNEWEDDQIELLSVCFEFVTDEVLRHRLTRKLESMLVEQTDDFYNKYRMEEKPI